MSYTSIINKTIIPALFLSLISSSALSQEFGESIKAKGRSAPHSGIENLKTYCTFRVDSEVAKGIYEEFPELVGMIESALDRNFQDKGFSKAETDLCDIEMHYEVTLQDQKQLSNQTYNYSVVSGVTDKKGKLRTGQLNLDAYNKTQNRKIWKGQATNTKGVYIDLNKPRDEDIDGVRERVNLAVDKLFMRFPARTQ